MTIMLSRKVTAQLETITPDEARAILDRSAAVVKNRRISQPVVEGLRDVIVNGEWKLNGKTIVLDENGFLLDGQHRLSAIVLAGIAVQTLVARGVDRATFPTIDCGGRGCRTAGDVIDMVGVKNATHVASAVGWIQRHQRDMMMHTSRAAGMTNTRALELVKENPEILKCVEWAVSARGKSVVASRASASVMAFLRFMFDRHNPEKATIFFDMVFDEIANPKGTVTRLYRDWILKGEKKSQVETIVYGIKAWTMFLSGRTVQKLLWKRGDTAEAFPAFPGDSSRPARKVRRPSKVRA